MTGRGLAAAVEADGAWTHVHAHSDLQKAPASTANMCCFGAAATEGDGCTCWEPVLDLEQQPLQEGPMGVRRIACHNCAYRAGSPERAAAGGALPDNGRSRPFMCHQGMPRVIAIEHPAGERREMTEDGYSPVQHDGRAWLADGRPAEHCAGWAAVNRVRS